MKNSLVLVLVVVCEILMAASGHAQETPSRWDAYSGRMRERREERRATVDRWLGRNGSQEASYTPGKQDYEFQVTVDGKSRRYFVHLPKEFEPQRSTAVILSFHGGGGSSLGHAKVTKFNSAADRHGFIAVFPEGTRPDGDPDKKYQRFWNVDGPNGAMNTAPTVLAADDGKYTEAILDDLEQKYNVDKARVFATGFSNGAVLTHYLGCVLSERIAAISPIGAPMWNDSKQCHPRKPISVIYFHGTADTCAPFYGGESQCEKGFANKGRVFPPAPDTFLIWKEKEQCIGEPEIVYQHGDVTCSSYQRCRDGAEIEFCKIEGAGHTWPGGEKYSIPGMSVGEVTKDIDANEAMWEFFSKHPHQQSDLERIFK